MRLHDYTPPVAAAGMWSLPTPEELTDATARVIERLQADRHVDPLAAAYQAVLEAAGRRMASAFRAQAVALTAAGFVPPDEDEVVNGDRLADEIGELAGEAQREAGRVVVAELDDEGISYDVDTVFTEELLERVAANAAFNIEGELRGTYRNTLETAAEFGWSVRDTADALQVKVADLAPHTARAIARTELNGLANGGSVHVASKTVGKDQTLYKNWLATDDERTRDTHVEANGQSVLVNDQFTVGGAALSYPGWPFGPPEEVINCRCTVTYSSQPAGTVVVDPDAPARDPLAYVMPSDDMVEAMQAEFDNSLIGEEWSRGLADYQRTLEEKLTAELAAPGVDVRVRAPADIALEIIEAGRFKSQFESGRSGGAFAPGLRATAEEHLFSYPRTEGAVPHAQRPIYGYVGGITREAGQVQQYGDVVFVLKNEVRQRTTWTSGDSLGLDFAPSPLNRPSSLSVGARWDEIEPVSTPMRDWSTMYFEAQVHGGVSVDDVERVIVYWHDPGYEGTQYTADLLRQQAQDIAADVKQALGSRDIVVSVEPLPLRSSGEQVLSLGHDRLGVNVGGDVVPVAASDDAERRHNLADVPGAAVEHAHLGGLEPVAAAASEEHERVVASLGDHLHASDDTASGDSRPPTSAADGILRRVDRPYWEQDDEQAEVADPRVQAALDVLAEVAAQQAESRQQELDAQQIPLRVLTAALEGMNARLEASERRHQELLTQIHEADERNSHAVVAALEQVTARVAAGEQLNASLVSALQDLSRPKRLVRDNDGRIAGVEPADG